MMYRAGQVILALLITAGVSENVCCAAVLTCQSEQTQTFDFPVNTVVQSTLDLISGAATAGAGEFAVASLRFEADQFVPLAAQQATVNNEPGTNPLFDASITLVSPFSRTANAIGSVENALAVTQSDPNTIYLTTRVTATNTQVLSLGLVDRNMNPVAGIAAVASVSSASAVSAVLGNGNTDFTAAGGGIARIGTARTRPIGKVREQEILRQDLPIPLDATVNAIMITQPLQTISDQVAMHYDPGLGVLFTGICAQANTNAADGIKGVARLRFQMGRPVEQQLNQIAPDAVFTGVADKIVGAIGANEQVCIHAIKTVQIGYQVDTGIAGPRYLLVLGGNGTFATTRQQIYALPIVSVAQTEEALENLGLLADVTQRPVTITTGSLQQIAQRGFEKPAESTAQLFTDASIPALVGGGPFDVPIESFFVVKQAIFAVVQQEGSRKPGLFFSEPIIDFQGVVQGWTTWKRYGNISQAISAAAVVTERPRAISFEVDGATTAVRATIWSNNCQNGFAPLNTFVTEHLTSKTGGIHAVQSFVSTTPGLDQIGLLTFAGADSVVLTQTNQDDGAGVDEPVAGTAFTSDAKQFFDDTISQTFMTGNATRSISISGSVLHEIGCKTAIAIGIQTIANPSGYLFVGGVNGLAILIDQSGAGWDASAGLSSGFVGLTDGMQFSIISGFSNIRALQATNGFLYVLRDTSLDRIDLNLSDFATGTIVTTQLATPSDLSTAATTFSGFTDMIASEKVVLLGTTFGLFVNGVGTNVQTAVDPVALNWQRLILAGGSEHVVRIVALSASGNPADVSSGIGGIAYVLNGDIGAQFARVNRFAIQSTESSNVTDQTVQPVMDEVFVGLESFYAAFGTFRSRFATDSALLISAQNGMAVETAIGEQAETSALLKTFIEPRGATIPLGSGFIDRVAFLAHAPGSGAWLAVTDAGLQANE